MDEEDVRAELQVPLPKATRVRAKLNIQIDRSI